MTDYVIRSGDTLSGIAKKYGMTVTELQKLNAIKNVNQIQAGAVLKLNSTTSTDNYVSTNSAEQTDGTLSDKTQIASNNMKNLKTAYNDLIENAGSFPLPKGFSVEKFKELIKGGYQAHIVNNDLPETQATPADFACDLLINAYNEVDGNQDIQHDNLAESVANMYPESSIGGVKCSEILKGNAVVDYENETISLKENVANQNKDNLNSAYEVFTRSLKDFNFSEGTDINILKEHLEKVYQNHTNDLPETVATEAEFSFSMIFEALKEMYPDKDVQELQKDTIKLVASRYKNDTIGGISCTDLISKEFSIDDNKIILQ